MHQQNRRLLGFVAALIVALVPASFAAAQTTRPAVDALDLVTAEARKARISDVSYDAFIDISKGDEAFTGEVFIDFPAKHAMFQLDLLVERSDGQVERLGAGGLPGLIDLPRLAEGLYTTTRVLRVFTFERRSLDRDRVLERITRAG